ncbi:uncharacterized protein LACBIDRAFT_333829 [Laccaria bicolor S238N-H82]|uniref:Predicted protein n=1 Tax=Laccaria bicolor (strain S238N-H82 / ATCC MYA-4686) TaxID=486041 RepID=B0DX76_LACBS|nr:uncharacterized protein LACBIDRAFT_333829 [Laccaria bicolor S238N-H82]EDR00786.1 predicted protein [Laccaria bicolor S238N-H82]|eukprot:XP_001888578.1 predicted protein [Laccaria bicolor S238N-H82]
MNLQEQRVWCRSDSVAECPTSAIFHRLPLPQCDPARVTKFEHSESLSEYVCCSVFGIRILFGDMFQGSWGNYEKLVRMFDDIFVGRVRQDSYAPGWSCCCRPRPGLKWQWCLAEVEHMSIVFNLTISRERTRVDASRVVLLAIAFKPISSTANTMLCTTNKVAFKRSPLTHLSVLRSTTAAPRRSMAKDRKKENKRLLQELEKTKGLLAAEKASKANAHSNSVPRPRGAADENGGRYLRLTRLAIRYITEHLSSFYKVMEAKAGIQNDIKLLCRIRRSRPTDDMIQQYLLNCRDRQRRDVKAEKQEDDDDEDEFMGGCDDQDEGSPASTKGKGVQIVESKESGEEGPVDMKGEGKLMVAKRNGKKRVAREESNEEESADVKGKGKKRATRDESDEGRVHGYKGGTKAESPSFKLQRQDDPSMVKLRTRFLMIFITRTWRSNHRAPGIVPWRHEKHSAQKHQAVCRPSPDNSLRPAQPPQRNATPGPSKPRDVWTVVTLAEYPSPSHQAPPPRTTRRRRTRKT